MSKPGKYSSQNPHPPSTRRRRAQDRPGLLSLSKGEEEQIYLWGTSLRLRSRQAPKLLASPSAEGLDSPRRRFETASKYLSLGIRSLALVALLASLWPWVADPYDGLVVAGAARLAPAAIQVHAGEGRIYVDFPQSGPGSGMSVDGSTLHFGLILVAAVVAASPGLGLRRKAAWLLAAVGLFPLGHIAGLSLWLLGLSAALDQEATAITFGRVMTSFALFWAMLPALVAGAWCYRVWLPALRQESANRKVQGTSVP